MAARRLLVLLLCLLFTLSACGPAASAPVTGGTPAPVEPAKASAAPSASAGGAATPSALPADTLHITWLYDYQDPEELKPQLNILQDLLSLGGWHVKLDLIPDSFRDNPAGYATDAYMTLSSRILKISKIQYCDADLLFENGVTMDAAQLCAQYAPVLAEKYADLLTPSCVPMEIQRFSNNDGQFLLLLRDWAPKQWLVTPPAISDVVTWVEHNNVALGRVESADLVYPEPFPEAMDAWAQQKGYYPLNSLGIYKNGGLYVRAGDAEMQPVPIESIAGFDDMYRRLLALYRAGKYFESDTRPTDTVGYWGSLYEVDDRFLQANHVTADDVVAVPIQGTAWQGPDAHAYIGAVLAIPKDSRHIEQILKLVEWAMTTREGYDIANYGVLKQDYTLQGDRLQIVKGGRADGLYFHFVWDDTMARIRSGQPANTADVMKLITYAKLPALNTDKLGDFDASKYTSALDAIVDPIREANDKLISDRADLIEGLIPGSGGKDPHPATNADTALKLLRSLDSDGAVEKMAQQFQVELLKLTK